MSGNGAKLLGLTKALSNQWQETKHYWRDAKANEFEQKYIQELMTSVEHASTVIEQLDKLVAKIRKDCE